MNAGILFIPSEMDLLFSRRVKPGFFLQVRMVDFQYGIKKKIFFRKFLLFKFLGFFDRFIDKIPKI